MANDKNKKHINYIQSILFIVITLLIVFWPFIDNIIPPWVRFESILGVCVGLIGFAFFYMNTRFSDIINGFDRLFLEIQPKSAVVSPLTLFDCFNQVKNKFKHIRNLRIYAISTGIILPYFKESYVGHVDNCIILVSYLPGYHTALYSSIVESLMDEWKKLEKNKVIGSLRIKRYNFFPTEYQVIIDNDMLIWGNYEPSSNSLSLVDPQHPVLIENNSNENNKLIQQCVARFDKLMSEPLVYVPPDLHLTEYLKKEQTNYNDIAQEYTIVRAEQSLKKELDKFAEQVVRNHGHKVLDAGCGPGRDVNYLVKKGLNVIGVDMCTEFIQIAKGTTEQAEFLLMNILHLNFHDNTIDGIWCCSVLPTMKDDDVKKALFEFHRVLKPRGVLFFTVKKGSGEGEDTEFKRHRFTNYFKENEIIRLVTEQGLDIKETYTINEKERFPKTGRDIEHIIVFSNKLSE